MNYEIDRITCHSYNGRINKIEKAIDNVFDDYKYSCVSSIKSEDLKIMLDALFEAKGIYHNIYTIPMVLVSTGLSITIPLESNEPESFIPQLREIIHLIGKPTGVFENDGKFYANWVRNIVTWF